MVCARILGLLWWWPRTWPSDEARFGAGGQRGGCDRAVYARLIRSKCGPAEVEVGLPGTPTGASRPAALVSPASRAVSLPAAGRDVRVARPSAGARCAPVPPRSTRRLCPLLRSASRDACFWFQVARAGAQLAEGALLRCARRTSARIRVALHAKRPFRSRAPSCWLYCVETAWKEQPEAEGDKPQPQGPRCSRFTHDGGARQQAAAARPHFTRERSLVRNQPRPWPNKPNSRPFRTRSERSSAAARPFPYLFRTSAPRNGPSREPNNARVTPEFIRGLCDRSRTRRAVRQA